MHEIKQEEYMSGIIDIVCSSENLNRENEKQFKHFMRTDVLQHSQNTLAMILRKCLDIWGLTRPDAELKNEEVEDFGALEI